MLKGQKAGPKGRQLEVGAQRAPRLPVITYFLNLCVDKVRCRIADASHSKSQIELIN